MDELNIPHSGARAGLASASYRVQRRSSMDPSTRRLALVSGGLGSVLVLIVAFWSVSGHHDGPIPVIQADKTPLRVKPDNPGGLQIAGMSQDFLSTNGDTKVQATAPMPEQPDPKALRPDPQPVKPQPLANEIPAAAVPAKQSPPVASAPVAVARTETAPTGHGTEVQLASMESEQAAHAEWERLTRRMPSLLAKRRPEFARADVNGRVYWRIRTTGFEGVAQATSFCEQVRSKGGGCSVAAF